MPKVEVKETIGCTKKLHVEIERERLDKEIESTLKTFNRNVQLPGFRKGKAPGFMLMKRFGKNIQQEALKEMIPKVLVDVFKTEGINPVGEPALSDLVLEETGPVTFTITVEEYPEIDSSIFEGLKVTNKMLEITDDIVEGEIEYVLKSHAAEKEVKREVQMGDVLKVNLQKIDSSGVQIIGEKMESHIIYLDGQSTPSPEFDEQVLGMKKGERRIVRFEYDKSINNPDLIGKTDAYEIELLQVFEKNIPELNDKFVSSIGGFTSVEDFREKTKENLTRIVSENAKQQLHFDFIKEYINKAPFEVPGNMVERIIQSEVERFRELKTDKPIDEDTLRSDLRPDAVRMVQTFLIINAVKDQKNIEVTREEINDRIETLARGNITNLKEFRRKIIKEGKMNEIKEEIADRKAYEWIAEVADVNIEIVKPKPEESRIIKP